MTKAARTPSNKADGTHAREAKGGAPRSKTPSEGRAPALRQNQKPPQKHQPHVPTHYEPPGFGLFGPLLPSLRAANFGTASPC